MKKLCKILLLCGLVFMGGCSKNISKENEQPQKDTTTLHIIVNNEKKEVFNKDVTVDGNVTSLEEFLEKADELDVILTDSKYGKRLDGMLNIETKDWNKGPWWLYSSTTNKKCKENNMCPAISDLTIENGDEFTFEFTSEM